MLLANLKKKPSLFEGFLNKCQFPPYGVNSKTKIMETKGHLDTFMNEV